MNISDHITTLPPARQWQQPAGDTEGAMPETASEAAQQPAQDLLEWLVANPAAEFGPGAGGD